MNSPDIMVISDIDPLTNRLGSSEYLDAVVTMLHEGGAKLRLVVSGMHGPGVVRVPKGAYDHYARHFIQVRLFRAVAIGRYIYSTDLWQWRDLLRRKSGKAPRRTQTWLGPIDRWRSRWASSIVRRVRPNLILCNYFNTVPIARDASDRIPICVLMHDFIVARKESFEAQGLEPDFHEAIVEAERTNLGNADLCIAIKTTDAEELRRVLPHAATITVPMTLQGRAFRPSDRKGPVALFVGGGFAANVNGLEWAMTEIWPKVQQAVPHARLRVVGKVADAVTIPWPEGAERVGFVDDLADEYAGARVVIAPLFIGSGMKIKVVEALGHGVQVLTTSCGAEGLEDIATEHLAITDDAEKFAQMLIEALLHEESDVVRKARHDFAQRRFGRAQVQATLLTAVETVRRRVQE